MIHEAKWGIVQFSGMPAFGMGYLLFVIWGFNNSNPRGQLRQMNR